MLHVRSNAIGCLSANLPKNKKKERQEKKIRRLIGRPANRTSSKHVMRWWWQHLGFGLAAAPDKECDPKLGRSDLTLRGRKGKMTQHQKISCHGKRPLDELAKHGSIFFALRVTEKHGTIIGYGCSAVSFRIGLHAVFGGEGWKYIDVHLHFGATRDALCTMQTDTHESNCKPVEIHAWRVVVLPKHTCVGSSRCVVFCSTWFEPLVRLWSGFNRKCLVRLSCL